jgi:hypothetical protein
MQNTLKITICFFIALFFACEFGFAQKTSSMNIMQHWMDSVQDYKAKNWENLYVEEKSQTYYDLCKEDNNASLKAIAFKREFEDVADTLTTWLQDADEKVELICNKIFQINNCYYFRCGNDFTRKFREEFNNKTWLEYAQTYNKQINKNPIKLIALLLLSKQNDEAILEMQKNNFLFFDIARLYVTLSLYTLPPKSLHYMDKYFAVTDTIPIEEQLPKYSVYRLFAYKALEAKAYPRVIEYLEKVPEEKYTSKDYSCLGEAYLHRGGSEADTTKAVNLLLKCFEVARANNQKH